MRLLLLSLLMTMTSAAADPSVNGKWKVHMSVAGNESDQDCTFAQKETSLTGTCVSDRGTVEVSGKWKGPR